MVLRTFDWRDVSEVRIQEPKHLRHLRIMQTGVHPRPRSVLDAGTRCPLVYLRTPDPRLRIEFEATSPAGRWAGTDYFERLPADTDFSRS
jgi:hypothetical protein